MMECRTQSSRRRETTPTLRRIGDMKTRVREADVRGVPCT
jgi:hypothetical protein